MGTARALHKISTDFPVTVRPPVPKGCGPGATRGDHVLRERALRTSHAAWPAVSSTAPAVERSQENR